MGQLVGHVRQPAGVALGNGYSQVAWGSGRLIFVAGQVAMDEQGVLVGGGDPTAQARHVFENLRRCLGAAGAAFGDVVKLAFFVTDVAFLPAIRKVRDEFIDVPTPPASTAVQVAALFRPEFLLEVEAYAVVPEGAR